jgi:hypothetical protein
MSATNGESIANFASLQMLTGNRVKFCSTLITLPFVSFARAPLYKQSELIAMSQFCEVQPEDRPQERLCFPRSQDPQIDICWHARA